MNLLISLFLVGVGGGIGAIARYLTTIGLGKLLGTNFPYGTLMVNIIGSCLMGLLVGWLTRYGQYVQTAHLFVAVGILGGFTTFSSFSMDAIAILQRGEVITAMLYVVGSVLLSLLALMGGLLLSRMMA